MKEDGTPLVHHPELRHGETLSRPCANNSLGVLALRCFDGAVRIDDGVCGKVNCGAGTVQSSGVDIEHAKMNNGWQLGPLICPAPLSGELWVSCSRGETAVSKVEVEIPIDDTDDLVVQRERFLICECCGTPKAALDPPSIDFQDSYIEIWWVGAALFVSICAAAAAGWIMAQGSVQKLAKSVSRLTSNRTKRLSSLKVAPTLPLADAAADGLATALEDLEPGFAQEPGPALQDLEPGQEPGLVLTELDPLPPGPEELGPFEPLTPPWPDAEPQAELQAGESLRAAAAAAPEATPGEAHAAGDNQMKP